MHISQDSRSLRETSVWLLRDSMILWVLINSGQPEIDEREHNTILEITLYQDIEKPREAWTKRLRKTNIAAIWDCFIPDYRKRKEKSINFIRWLERLCAWVWKPRNWLTVNLVFVLLLSSTGKDECTYHFKDLFFIELNKITVTMPRHALC